MVFMVIFNSFKNTLAAKGIKGTAAEHKNYDIEKDVNDNYVVMMIADDALKHTSRNDDDKKKLLSNLLNYISEDPNGFTYMGSLTRSGILKGLIARNPDLKKDLAELAKANPKNKELQAFNKAIETDAWELPKINADTANLIAGAWIDGVPEPAKRERPKVEGEKTGDVQAEIDKFYRNDLVFNLRQSDDLATKIFDSTGKLKISELNKLKETSNGKEVTGAAALAQKMINLNVTDFEEIKIVLDDLPAKEQNKFLSVMFRQLPSSTIETAFPLFINIFLDNNPKDEELKALFTDIQASPNKDIVLEVINNAMPDDKKYESLTDSKFLDDIINSGSVVRKAILDMRPEDIGETKNKGRNSDDRS